MSNRLARERSPYLLQHAENPVDWFPWGDEAFERARKDDKPIFLSIGYSTCHWCHVMEHESFEDHGIAERLNRDFVPIKVDREERPDVDRVYMTFVQATSGAGGWPMSVWLTPELTPFFGGTYFPPEARWGRPGFSDVLAEIARAWQSDRARVVRSASDIVARLREVTGAGGDAPDRAPVAGREAIDDGVGAFAANFDARHGGFGGAPKFPRPSELILLQHAYAFAGAERARRMALETLDAMARGGMRDQIGGGFHRYSVDALWRVPHFEKMLYDQAQLVLAYLEAAQLTGQPFYASVAEDTLDYVLRDLTAPDGAFWSAEDADSETPEGPGPRAHGPSKREGAFYVWTADDIDRLFGSDAAIMRRRFGVEEQGNAPSDPQGEFQNQNILYLAQTIEEVAVRAGRTPEDVTRVLVDARERLFAERNRRPRPHRDDKVITAWNGLMIAAFARAGRVLVDSPRRADWKRAAERAAGAVRKLLWRKDAGLANQSGLRTPGRLLRRYRDGDSAIDAFCEDYAYLVWGLVELFQTTGDAQWLEWALELTEIETTRFFDEGDGGWFSTTGDDPSVLLRLKEDYDGAEPSAASVTVRNLITLGHLVSDPSLLARAERTLERYGAGIGRVARVMPFMLANVVLWRAPAAQVVIVGQRGAADTTALESALARRYVPWAVTISTDADTPQPALAARLPWAAAMSARGGRATAYVCQGFSCREPVTDVAAFQTQLDEISSPRRVVAP